MLTKARTLGPLHYPKTPNSVLVSRSFNNVQLQSRKTTWVQHRAKHQKRPLWQDAKGHTIQAQSRTSTNRLSFACQVSSKNRLPSARSTLAGGISLRYIRLALEISPLSSLAASRKHTSLFPRPLVRTIHLILSRSSFVVLASSHGKACLSPSSQKNQISPYRLTGTLALG